LEFYFAKGQFLLIKATQAINPLGTASFFIG
jgi:hypothetical protein